MSQRFAAKLECLAIRGFRLKNIYPPLFIVGAPRCGTTLVYLHIVNAFDFGYFPNISKKHPRACVSYATWGKMRYHYEPSYENTFGIASGPLAPSDGWRIFHRWFPEYDYSRRVDEEHLYELRNIVRLFELIFQAPFVNKNNSNSVRIEYLNRLFPEALFIHVQRDPLHAALSLLDARKRQGISPDAWWGVAPPHFFDRPYSSEVERAVYQVWGVDAAIRRSLAQISSTRWRRVRYEEFCAEPNQLFDWLGTAYAQAGVTLKRRQAMLPEKFQVRSGNVKAEVTAHIMKILRDLATDSHDIGGPKQNQDRDNASRVA